jgi:hypothetical protein
MRKSRADALPLIYDREAVRVDARSADRLTVLDTDWPAICVAEPADRFFVSF